MQTSQWMPGPKPIPSDTCLFAIGDVHGCADELDALHGVIKTLAESSAASYKRLIHLGDYIDRGPDSRRTLEILATPTDGALPIVNLVGNHDQYLIELIRNPEDLDVEFMVNWYENGGISTMKSLDVTGYGRHLDQGNVVAIGESARHALGPELVEFLYSLKSVHREGDYVFVHAGVDPEHSLDDQDLVDLLLIREPFLSAAEHWNHPFCVVHGHSISPPAIHSHRIAVDAGCCAFGALCAVQLSDQGVRFIAVSKRGDGAWLEKLGGRAYSWEWSTATAL